MTKKRAAPLRGCFCCDQTTETLAAPDRRGFMLGAGALALAAAMRPIGATAQTADARPHRIDVHHHLSPPSYVTASNEGGFGDALMKNWTIEKSLADMDKAGIATSMLSVTTPGVNLTKGEVARRLCRESNEYAANWWRTIPAGSAILPCCR
jgi:6-methylsalicylate decarboxylase